MHLFLLCALILDIVQDVFESLYVHIFMLFFQRVTRLLTCVKGYYLLFFFFFFLSISRFILAFQLYSSRKRRRDKNPFLKKKAAFLP